MWKPASWQEIILQPGWVMDELMLEQLCLKKILKYSQKCLKVLFVWNDAIVYIVINFSINNSVNAMCIFVLALLEYPPPFQKSTCFYFIFNIPPLQKNPNHLAIFFTQFSHVRMTLWAKAAYMFCCNNKYELGYWRRRQGIKKGLLSSSPSLPFSCLRTESRGGIPSCSQLFKR